MPINYGISIKYSVFTPTTAMPFENNFMHSKTDRTRVNGRRIAQESISLRWDHFFIFQQKHMIPEYAEMRSKNELRSDAFRLIAIRSFFGYCLYTLNELSV